MTFEKGTEIKLPDSTAITSHEAQTLTQGTHKLLAQDPLNFPESIPTQELYEMIKLMNLYKGALKNVCTKLEFLDDEFSLIYDHNPIHHIESRIKSYSSIADKAKRKGIVPTAASIREHITDIAGVRVICPYIADVYNLADLMLSQKNYELVKQHDYIESPKENGYRSLHLVVSVPFDLNGSRTSIPVELQLRTLAMDMWASLEHEMIYKSHKSAADIDKLKLKICADDLSKIDLYMQEIYKSL